MSIGNCFSRISLLFKLTRVSFDFRFQIITVRNPFSRIVSAYYDKMPPGARGNTNAFKSISKRIKENFKRYRRNATERNDTDTSHATFEDFVNYLVFGHRSVHDNVHWARYNDTCHPCHHRYDYIFKLESVDEDVRYLKDRLNLSVDEREVFFPSSKYVAQDDLVKKTFASVPRETALKLYEIYKTDFDNFGYEQPRWLWLQLSQNVDCVMRIADEFWTLWKWLVSQYFQQNLLLGNRALPTFPLFVTISYDIR